MSDLARGENVDRVPRPPAFMSHSVFRPLHSAACAIALLLPLLLGSCSSSSTKFKGLPANLPVIDLHDTSSTPSHSMPHSEYPFDSGGSYNTTWAAEGETRAGRGAASGRDNVGWKSSHHDSGSRSSTKAKSTKSKTSSSKKSSGSRKHTVKSGDTLSGIARKYGTSVSKIKAANGLKSDMIRNGRTLTIPR